MQVSELNGRALNWAVAQCAKVTLEGGVKYMHVYDADLGDTVSWDPSTNWNQGGPIIDREKIRLDPRESYWHAQMWENSEVEAKYAPTALIAAMRCYVASKYGDSIEIPKELQSPV
jgi:hypothetical protein